MTVPKIRDAATVVLVDGMPKTRKGAPRNASRNSRVTRSQVNQAVLRHAMNLVDNDISRLKIIDEITIQILPEK